MEFAIPLFGVTSPNSRRSQMGKKLHHESAYASMVHAIKEVCPYPCSLVFRRLDGVPDRSPI